MTVGDDRAIKKACLELYQSERFNFSTRKSYGSELLLEVDKHN